MKDEKGQAVLIVVLVMAVVGVVTISVSDNAVKGLRVQQIGNESINALKGAEAALEIALKSRSSVPDTTETGNLSYNASFNSVGSSGFMTNDVVEPGNVTQVLTTGAEQIRIYFQNGAALRIAEYWGDSPNTGVTYYTVDSLLRVSPANNFESIGSGCSSFGVTFPDGQFTFDCMKEITLNANTKFVRTLVLYQSTRVGVEPTIGSLPNQKDVISASGTVNKNTANAQISRQIVYTQLGKRLPAIFDSALHTNNNLTQN